MKTETKINLYNNLFNSIIFGVAFTIIGGLITTGTVDWNSFPISALVGVLAGFVIGLIIPIGKIGAAAASKVSKPGTFLFSLVMNAVLLILMLLFMCPVLTIFMGSVLMGAPISAVLPNSYALFIPFFFIGLILLTILGGFVMKLSMKCAGMPAETNQEVA
ncbi:hypothetical protein [Acetobacterium wieringae]|uniref:Uncharacterized protein n=1 Tax=Acetobacterium wieringae TaxID=52694 RepID=A0A1F2PEV5_9FIRM|nr:hypothetical protein [Acetobacterium wieringae]OFV69221.1 hypothetical protein ACWI_32650 [Acetobacterium wieringae]